MVAGASLVVFAIAVLPRAAGDVEAAPQGAPKLTVLSANVLRGRANPDGLLALVDRVQPDLLAVQELPPRFAAKLRQDGLARSLPHSLISRGNEGMESGLFSNYPLRRLPSTAPHNPRMPRAELTLPQGERIKVINVHPFTPTGAHAGEWAEELSELPSAAGNVPWLLVGDFNATLDHAELREVLNRGYRDAGDVAGEGLTPTWPRNHAYPH